VKPLISKVDSGFEDFNTSSFNVFLAYIWLKEGALLFNAGYNDQVFPPKL